MKRFGLLALAAAVSLGMVAAGPAPALAEYPERPVTFIVPWPPGDLEDALTRMIADELTASGGAPGKVVNRPGGGGVEGATAVTQAAPDGYTVGSLVIDALTTNIIKKAATFDRASLEPVGIFMTYPFALVASKDAPFSTLKELAAHSQSNAVSLGHFGYDSVPTMATFKAAKDLGIKFSADAPAEMLDCGTLSSGTATVINTTMALVLPCLDKIKVIASYTAKPLSLFPEAQLLKDASPGNDIVLWNGLFVPKGTPQDVKDKLAAVAQKALKSDKAMGIAKETGVEIYWLGGAEAQKQVDTDYARAEALVKEVSK